MEPAAVSFAECYNDIVVNSGPNGREEYEKWIKRPGYEAVVKFVREFRHEYIFSVTSKQVRAKVEQSSHALGNVQSNEQIKFIEDFTTPFAFQHIFHSLVEEIRSVPTWREFRDWVVIGKAKPCWYDPLREALVRQHGSEPLPAEKRRAWSRAARWRLGKVYLSNIREIDMLSRLRESGLPVKYHVLADVLMRVDFWVDNIIICTYSPNEFYRSGISGRKKKAEQLFENSETAFRILHLQIEHQGAGQVWLASQQSMDKMIAEIKRVRSKTD